jgi:phosphoribosylanthranilate isomerase
MRVGEVRIKVCGVTCVEDADACLAVGIDAIGVNLVADTPRAVDVATARRIAAHVGRRALSVAVVANRSVDDLRAVREATGIACLQLHGDEPVATLEALLPHAYKAIRVGGPEDVERARAYPGEYLLVDAKVAGKLGGTGAKVDFSLVAPLARERKLTLAGGLTAENVADAIRAVAPFCVDVASGVELAGEPRRKDPARIAAFVRAARG